MKDKLEDFIRNNRKDFDIFETDEDKLWEGINKNITLKKKNRWIKYSIRAAAVIIIFVMSYFVNQYISKGHDINNTREIAQNCEIPEDIVETEAYYVQQVSVKLNEVNQYAVSDPEILENVQYDFSQLDSIYTELKNDLCDNIDNEYVVEAMIQNYRMKLQILEEILTNLRKIKKYKNENIESYTL